MMYQNRFIYLVPHHDDLGLGSLEFRNHRNPFQADKSNWDQVTNAQINKCMGDQLRSIRVRPDVDVVDVVLKQNNMSLFQLYLRSLGSGELFVHNPTVILGTFAQHYFDFALKPENTHEQLLAYRLLLDLRKARDNFQESLKYPENFRPDVFLKELKDQGIDLERTPEFREWQHWKLFHDAKP